MTSIYFVNPASDFPTYFNGESYAACGYAPATLMADLAVPTLAAMAAPFLDVQICDQHLGTVDWETTADFVGITGKISQYRHMVAIASKFRARGKVVIIGGPFASLSPDAVRPHCDVLVRGEIEEIAPKIFSDLRDRTWQEEYIGGQPGLELSPIPRWDLYPLARAVRGTVQTSRGCPFECEFCDVIQYAGRKQRHKPVQQVTQELDVLYRHGIRSVFLADDNFTIFRTRAKDLLRAIEQWNRRQTDGPVTFITQVSIDVAKDDEMLDLCVAAGLTTVFVGLETPNAESLKETKKRQNLHTNLVDQVRHLIGRGIHVIGGMIVGFDADGPDIFQQQHTFATDAAIPIVSVGALVAPAATPLHARMKSAGRLKDNQAEVAAVPWSTNIKNHPRLSEAQLLDGLRWLANSLYAPDAFGDRLLALVDHFGSQRDPDVSRENLRRRPRSIEMDSLDMSGRVRQLGRDEQIMWDRVMAAARRKPAAAFIVTGALVQYMQVRHMYDAGNFWDPQVSATSAPGSSPDQVLRPLARPISVASPSRTRAPQ